MKNKGQHYITRSYQSNFSDKDNLVWVSTETGKIFKTSPENIFKEKHFYTVKLPGFPKPLFVENTLAGFEGDFSNVIKNRIAHSAAISDKERLSVSVFVALMQTRTKILRESFRDFFNRVIADGEVLKAEMKKRPQLKQLYSIESGKNSISMEELKEGMKSFDSQFALTTIGIAIKKPPRLIFNMEWIFFIAPDSKFFICSDSPVYTCSPAREKKYGRDTFGARAGLGHADVELTMPISSTIALFGHWNEKNKRGINYINASERQV